jgi:hypothetical protein
MFIQVTNHYLGLDLNGPTSQFLDLSSYYHGRSSGCAYGLFELIPRVASLAKRSAVLHPRHLAPGILEEFYTVEQEILSWEVPEFTNTKTYPRPGPDRDEITAALFTQMALIITLQCALSGPGVPDASIRGQIDTGLCEANLLLKQISPSSMAWATLLWPLAHVGSCIVSQKEQEDSVLQIFTMDNKVRGCTVSISVLSNLWKAAREDERYYGPYGIREFIKREGIKPCLG